MEDLGRYNYNLKLTIMKLLLNLHKQHAYIYILQQSCINISNHVLKISELFNTMTNDHSHVKDDEVNLDVNN